MSDAVDGGLFAAGSDRADECGSVCSRGGGGRDFDPEILSAADRALLIKTNQVIQKAGADMGERFRFNTALSAIMELSNEIGVTRIREATQAGDVAQTAGDVARVGGAVLAYALEMMVRLLEPFAPHMGAELWQMMGRSEVWDEPWPEADPRFLSGEMVELAVQINGKVRDRVTVPRDAADADVLAASKSLPGVARYLEDMTLVKEVVVPGRLVSLVVK